MRKKLLRIVLLSVLLVQTIVCEAQKTFTWYQATEFTIHQHGNWAQPRKVNKRISIDFDSPYFAGVVMIYGDVVETYTLKKYLGWSLDKNKNKYDSWTFINDKQIGGTCHLFDFGNGIFSLQIELDDHSFGIAYKMVKSRN